MRPSVYSVVSVDYPAFAMAMFPPVCLAMAGLAWTGWFPVGDNDTPEGAASFLLGLSALTVVLAVPGISWRVRRTWRAFDAGRRVPGQVVAVQGGRGRAWITFRYDLDGTLVEAKAYVTLGKEATALAPGSAVTVAVDPRHPGEAVIADLFAGPPSR